MSETDQIASAASLWQRQTSFLQCSHFKGCLVSHGPTFRSRSHYTLASERLTDLADKCHYCWLNETDPRVIPGARGNHRVVRQVRARRASSVPADSEHVEVNCPECRAVLNGRTGAAPGGHAGCGDEGGSPGRNDRSARTLGRKRVIGDLQTGTWTSAGGTGEGAHVDRNTCTGSPCSVTQEMLPLASEASSPQISTLLIIRMSVAITRAHRQPITPFTPRAAQQPSNRFPRLLLRSQDLLFSRPLYKCCVAWTEVFALLYHGKWKLHQIKAWQPGITHLYYLMYHWMQNKWCKARFYKVQKSRMHFKMCFLIFRTLTI